MAYTPTEGAKLKATQAYEWLREAKDHLSDAKKLAKQCNEYYDNEQWSKKDLDELEERKQPPTTNNHIKPTVDLVLGTETRMRVDFKGVPRTAAHIQDATTVTHLLKYIMDQSGGEYVFSDAFAGMVKSGWAVVEVGKSNDPFKEPVFVEVLDRDHIVWDPHARKYQRDDGKYIIRAKWLDIEDAEALYPEYKNALRAAIEDAPLSEFKQPYQMTGDERDPHGSVFDWEGEKISHKDWIDTARKQLRLLEVWYKVPVKTWVVENTTTGLREELNLGAPDAIITLMDPAVRVFRANIRKVRMAMVAGPNVLEDKWSPYRHNEYPFVFFWAYIRDKDRTPYSLVKQMLSPQDQINKRSSKALHILSTAQVIIDARGDENLEEIREEAARPDGVLRKPKDGELKINRDTNLAKAQFELYKDAINEINLCSGINQDLGGHQTNAQSGKAILARQSQGSTVLNPLFDNYKRSRQWAGMLMFANVKQYYTIPKIIQITDKMGQYQFITINEQTQDENGQPAIRNDIAHAQVDVKIDEQAYAAAVREALLAQLMELVSNLASSMPMVALALLDLVASYTDVPERDEIVRRIQTIQAQAGVVMPAGTGPESTPVE